MEPDETHDEIDEDWTVEPVDRCETCHERIEDCTCIACGTCLDGEVVNDTCDDCHERHCPTCEPCR